MYVEDVKDTSNTPKGCNAMYVEDVRQMGKALTYTVFDGMVEKLITLSFPILNSDFQSIKY